jgi:predicted RNase H-like HicB family nuclease
MRYPIVIEEGTSKTAYGVIVPDMPGCFSAGDTLEEAIENAEEAAAAWIDAALDDGRAIPAPSKLAAIKRNRAYKGWTFGVVAVDPDALDDSLTRINVSISKRVLRRLDAKVKQSGEKDRSAFIAKMAMG